MIFFSAIASIVVVFFLLQILSAGWKGSFIFGKSVLFVLQIFFHFLLAVSFSILHIIRKSEVFARSYI